jgi:hypothetical protein
VNAALEERTVLAVIEASIDRPLSTPDDRLIVIRP